MRRQPLDHPAIQAGLREHRHVGVAVAALEVDHVHTVEARELIHERGVPAGRRIELEPQPGSDGEQLPQREEARRLPDPDRRHEADGPGGAADGLFE